MYELDGWKSAEAKSRFSKQATIVAIGLLVAQMLLPTIAAFGAVRNLRRLGFANADAGSAAWFHEREWFVETSPAAHGGMTKRLASVSVDDDAPPMVGPAIPEATRYLAADGANLWLVGRKTLERYDGSQVVKSTLWAGPTWPSTPFVYDGHLALFDWRECRLKMFHLDGDAWAAVPGGAWTLASCDATPGTWSVLPAGSGFDVFAQFGRELRWHHIGTDDAVDDPAGWERISDQASFWTAARQDSQSVVLLATQRGPFDRGLAVLRRGDSGWTTTSKVSLGTLGAFAVTPTDDHTLPVVASVLQSLTTLELTGDAVSRRHVHRVGAGFPITPQWLMLLVGLSMLPVGIGAVLIARLMRRDRADTHAGHARVDGPLRYASILQRGVAHAVDFSVSWVAVLPFTWRIVKSPETFLLDPRSIIAPGLVSCACWVATLLVMTCAEGRWGRTPGKWLAGIRVVGADGAPIGFSRALKRNLLRLIDGGMNGAVAILLVAFSPAWQRLGDIVAKTVVVRTRG